MILYIALLYHYDSLLPIMVWNLYYFCTVTFFLSTNKYYILIKSLSYIVNFNIFHFPSRYKKLLFTRQNKKQGEMCTIYLPFKILKSAFFFLTQYFNYNYFYIKDTTSKIIYHSYYVT